MPLSSNVIRFPLEERMGDNRVRAKLAEIVRPARFTAAKDISAYQKIIDLLREKMEREGK